MTWDTTGTFVQQARKVNPQPGHASDSARNQCSGASCLPGRAPFAEFVLDYLIGACITPGRASFGSAVPDRDLTTLISVRGPEGKYHVFTHAWQLCSGGWDADAAKHMLCFSYLTCGVCLLYSPPNSKHRLMIVGCIVRKGQGPRLYAIQAQPNLRRRHHN